MPGLRHIRTIASSTARLVKSLDVRKMQSNTSNNQQTKRAWQEHKNETQNDREKSATKKQRMVLTATKNRKQNEDSFLKEWKADSKKEDLCGDVDQKKGK